jgi:hypothetical protein
MTPVQIYFALLCSVAVSLSIAALLYLLLAVWPEVRAYLRLRCLAMRVDMEGQSVDMELSELQPSQRVRRRRRASTTNLESRDEHVSARSVEDWRYEHGLGPLDPLPEGYEVRGGVVVAVRSNNPMVRDPEPVPVLRIR